MSGDAYVIRNEEAPHFMTCTIVDWIDVFTRKECKDIIVDTLNFCVKRKGLIIYAWCLMSNHLHLIAAAQDGIKLSHIIRDFKKWTARRIIEWVENNNESRKEWMLHKFSYHARAKNNLDKYHVWQFGYHGIELDSADIFWQKIYYTHDNPVRAAVVAEPADYLHSSAIDYAGRKGLVEVVVA